MTKPSRSRSVGPPTRSTPSSAPSRRSPRGVYTANARSSGTGSRRAASTSAVRTARAGAVSRRSPTGHPTAAKRARDRAPALIARRRVRPRASRPVRRRAPVVIDAGRVLEIVQIRPVVLVEAGHLLERLARDVHDEALLRLVDRQRRPRQREQLAAEPEESAEREHGIRDATRGHIDHQLLDPPDVLPRQIDDSIPDERSRAE